MCKPVRPIHEDRSIFDLQLIILSVIALFSMSDCIDVCVTRFSAEEDAIEEEELFCGVGTGVLGTGFLDGLPLICPT